MVYFLSASEISNYNRVKNVNTNPCAGIEE